MGAYTLATLQNLADLLTLLDKTDLHWIDIIPYSDIDPGSCRSIELEKDLGIALFNVEGQIYALENVCPHAGGPLGEGTLEGDVVVCPWHGWKFNVCSGIRLKNPSEAWTVPPYPVRIENGIIQIAIAPTPTKE